MDLNASFHPAKFYIPKAIQASFEYPVADQCIMIHSNKYVS